MRWLITGANGQLGQSMSRLLTSHGEEFHALSSSELDISDEAAVNNVLSAIKPDVVVNAAAYTAVDKAESEHDSAYKVNETGPALLASWCAGNTAHFIHVSTDYVFSGEGRIAWKETDAVDPQSVYGASKLAGEQAVFKICPEAIILRTAWVFSEYRNNFVKTMVKLAQQRDQLSVVADQIGCPTYAGDIARAIYSLMQQREKKGKVEVKGLYHFAGDIAVSWWAFAREIHQQALAVGLIERCPTLGAIPSSEYPTPATRPVFSVLDCSKVVAAGVEPSNWKAGLQAVLESIKAEGVR
ncbi:dTDP-4-dehydrorhamnose reductase [Oceanobacter sp. 3_MG-2023]|uniref:dTDP-4-dehydrorhamnose reductase n=1 Tax=Oceanobacter sp. 3_MG-2023 TaxID=3062622 RepID=UPI0027361391|nr:dTDP-4-dehydrorhamnose reductase [Oceanobacter sp. 3_MG-2023]MDP2505328.1 dTDP-4-dehydrorhamnose reductase [Oceanobacter sp. 3_MG-2023]